MSIFIATSLHIKLKLIFLEYWLNVSQMYKNKPSVNALACYKPFVGFFSWNIIRSFEDYCWCNSISCWPKRCYEYVNNVSAKYVCIASMYVFDHVVIYRWIGKKCRIWEHSGRLFSYLNYLLFVASYMIIWQIYFSATLETIK